MDLLDEIKDQVQNAEFPPYNAKLQAILLRNKEASKLILKHKDEYCWLDHQSNFRIWRNREEIRSWEKKCTECKKRKPTAAT